MLEQALLWDHRTDLIKFILYIFKIKIKTAQVRASKYHKVQWIRDKLEQKSIINYYKNR